MIGFKNKEKNILKAAKSFSLFLDFFLKRDQE